MKKEQKMFFRIIFKERDNMQYAYTHVRSVCKDI